MFSVLDIQKFKNRIEKTAFSCYMGHYQLMKLPFGVNGGSAIFRRCMHLILTGLKGTDCLAYLDDLICYLLPWKSMQRNWREYLRG
jgi:hypothetical protein